MLDVDADQFGAPQGPGEAEQEEGAVPQSGQVVAADIDEPLDFGRGQGSRASGRLTVGACDPAERFPDSRMTCVEGMLGDAVSPGNGRNPTAKRG